MRKYLYVVGDTNDADYVSELSEISEEDFKLVLPVIKAIKNFKPYTVERIDQTYSKTRTHYHNFSNGDCLRDDLGEKTPEEIYVKSGLVDEEAFFLFAENYVPHGIHSITSIEIYEVTDKKKFL